MSKRGETWFDEEVSALISIWSQEEIWAMLDDSHKNADVYGIISTKLTEQGFHRNCNNAGLKSNIISPNACNTEVFYLYFLHK